MFKKTVKPYLTLGLLVRMKSGAVFALVTAGSIQSAQAAQNAQTIPIFDQLPAWVEPMKDLVRDKKVQKLIRNGLNRFKEYSRDGQKGWVSVKHQHIHHGFEVVGSVMIQHFNGFEKDQTDQVKKFSLNLEPSLTIADAIQVAENQMGSRKIIGFPQLKILPRERQNDSADLVYWIEFDHTAEEAGMDVVVHAHSGEVLAEIPAFCSMGAARPREPAPPPPVVAPPVEPPTKGTSMADRVDIYSAKDVPDHFNSPFTGAPTRVDLGSYKKVIVGGEVDLSADASAMRALANAEATLSYYKHTHGRDGFDGKGARSVNIVHIGENYANAFWDARRQIMAYGDGDGRRMRDLTHGKDVAGHEMTHGVISFSSRLVYMGESGALNEAFADFFGELIEGTPDWAVGKEIGLSAPLNQFGLRNLADPHRLMTRFQDTEGNRLPYPKSLDEKLTTTATCSRANDNCFVHVNSTIFGHAAYQMVQAIGKEKTEDLMYAVMTRFLSPRATLEEAFTATQQACRQLFDSTICEQVAEFTQ